MKLLLGIITAALAQRKVTKDWLSGGKKEGSKRHKGILKIVAQLLLISTMAIAKPLPNASPESVDMSSDRLRRIVPVMQGYVDNSAVSGITTAVMRHGKIVHLESVGLRDIERKLPMTSDTIFRIYSMTKPITSVAVMIL